MKGEVFEILPNGERRSIGKIVSIKQGGHEATGLSEVVVEIGRDSQATETVLAGQHPAISMGCICSEPNRERRVEAIAEALGLPMPTQEEKAAIYRASGLPDCDPNRVTEGFERAADLLEPLRDPTIEPLLRPQEPQ